MITKIIIKEPKFTIARGYWEQVPILSQRATIEFGPALNVLVGSNGCGKTTLCKLLAFYTCCVETAYSQFPFGYEQFAWERNLQADIYDGADVVNDYSIPVFSTLYTQSKNSQWALNDIQSFGFNWDYQTSSSGQQQGMSWNRMVMNLNEVAKNKIGFQKPERRDHPCVQNSILDYMERNQTPEDVENRYTIISDEPDRNIDIDNTIGLYDILCEIAGKKRLQSIVTLHNPLIIAKLLKERDDVNWIEMSEGYLDKVTKFANL